MRIESNRADIFGDVHDLHVFHHADDFNPLGGSRPLEAKLLAQRRATRKEPLGHRLADHCNFWRAGRVLCAEASAHHQRNAHRGKKVRTHNVVSYFAEGWSEVRLFTCVSRTGPHTLMECIEGK